MTVRSAIFPLLLIVGSPAAAESYWHVPEQIQVAINGAAALYATETHPDAPIEVADKPEELAALFAALEDRILPPLRIYTHSAEPDAAQDLSEIPTTFLPGSPEDTIIRYIRRFEAGPAGYDSVWHGNRHPLPKGRPTEMTICEVRDWQLEARKHQKSTAIGLYQIVGGTFRHITELMKLGCEEPFDARTQDRIGLALLYGRGWGEFKAGTLSIEDFAYELAGEWAAFPAPYGPKKGRSRYEGIAGNKHIVELDEYMAFLEDLKETVDAGGVSKGQDQLVLLESEISDNLDGAILDETGALMDVPEFEVVSLVVESPGTEESETDEASRSTAGFAGRIRTFSSD